jgi:hypothetical protein
VRRVPRISRISRISTRQGPGIGRLSRAWLAAALITSGVALLAPGVSHVTASPSAPPAAATLAAKTGTAAGAGAGAGAAAGAVGCRGVTPAVFPAQGFITNPSRSQGGHLWWRFAGDGTSVCIGTAVEFVQYNATTAKTWRVIVYTAQNPGGVTIARQTFTLGRGVYFWSFGVHRVFSGLSAVCLTATESFGTSCVHIG